MEEARVDAAQSFGALARGVEQDCGRMGRKWIMNEEVGGSIMYGGAQ